MLDNRRRWRFAFALTVGVALGSVAQADPRFDDGDDVTERFRTISEAMSALDTEPLLMTLSLDASIWTALDGRVQGVETIRNALAKRFAGRAKNAYRSTPPRVLLEQDRAWLVSEWEWDGETGIQIARLADIDGEWRVDRLDLDGKTAQVPDGDFDPRTPVAHLSETIETMERAATAFADGDFAMLERLLRPDFQFLDSAGRLYEAPDSFIVAAFTAPPDGVDKDKMTLYVSWNTDLAIAFQVVGGTRVSLQLVRFGGQWQVAKASLSEPLEALAAAPSGRLATTWASLRSPR